MKGVGATSTYEERRDQRFFQATRAALQDIEERLTTLPPEQWYAGAYGVLRGYFENLLVNFAEFFSSEQLAEIRIVLDQLSKITREDTDLDEATRRKRDQLAQALRDMEQEQTPDWKAIEAQAQVDLEHIETDKDAVAFIEKYLSKELRHQYLQIYRSDRHEMNRTPRQAIDNLLSLPPL